MPQKLITIRFREEGRDSLPVEVFICPLTTVGAVLKTLHWEDFCLFRESSGLKLSNHDDLFSLRDGEQLVGIKNTWVDDMEDD